MTISDIAKMAGVSSAAVSRYLNGGPLSEQKREAIREVVEKTGYRPDAAAQTLRTGRVNQIGVIAPSISSQSVGQITAGIASELDQQNYLILLGNTELDEQRELGYLTAMQRNHVAGIILLGCYYSPQLARAFKACRVPLVLGYLLLNGLTWAVLLGLGRPPLPVVAVAFLVFALGGPVSSIAFALVRDYNPIDQVGTATGIANVGGHSATALGVLAVGVVLDAVPDFRVALAALPVLLVVSAVRAAVTCSARGRCPAAAGTCSSRA